MQHKRNVAMTMSDAKEEARKIEVRSTELVNRKTYMTRLNNGVVGFGSTQEKSRAEAYHRCAINICRAINTGRISMLSVGQMKELSKVK